MTKTVRPIAQAPKQFKKYATRKSLPKKSAVPRAIVKPTYVDAPRFADFHDLLPGEPYWLIKGRDPLGEMFNMAWCMFRRYQIEMGLVPDNAEERTQLRVGFENASEMRIFAREYAIKREHALMKFGDDGHAISRDGVPIPRGKKGS